MKYISLVTIFSILLCAVPVSLAQTKTPVSFKVNTLVSDGKKSKEFDSVLTFSDNSFKTVNKKTGVTIKEFNYADVKTADYSYAKKPLLSTGGAIATAVLLGLVVIPFLFVKKKQHWLSVRTENDYVVMRLDKENFRQIQNEFEVHKVPINTVNEDEKSDKKK